MRPPVEQMCLDTASASEEDDQPVVIFSSWLTTHVVFISKRED